MIEEVIWSQMNGRRLLLWLIAGILLGAWTTPCWAGPDLVVTTFVLATGQAPSAAAGGTIEVEVDVKNQGDTTANNVPLHFYLSHDSNITIDDVFMQTEVAFAAITPGATVSWSGPLNLPWDMAPGTFYMGAIINDRGQIPETNTSNNSLLLQTGTGTIEVTATGAFYSKVGVFRDGLWVLDKSGNTQWDGPEGGDRFIYLGQAGDTGVVGDWNGSGTTKAGVFREGLWVFDYTRNGTWSGPPYDRFMYLGQAADVPVVGDWNGDGRGKPGVFRDGLWVFDYNGNGQWDGPSAGDLFMYLGQAGDIPVAGDWNGDGRSKAGVFRDGLWVLDYNGNGQWDGPSGGDRFMYLGQAGDIPVTGDWNGDGRSKAGIFRDGLWVFDYNGNGQWDGPSGGDRFMYLGQANDIPVVGNWNGLDGTDKAGVFRDGLWVLDLNGNGQWDGPPADRFGYIGQAGDQAEVGTW